MNIEKVLKVWENLENNFRMSGLDNRYEFLCKLTGFDGDTDLIDLLIQVLVPEETSMNKEQLKRYTNIRKILDKLKVELRKRNEITINLDTYIKEVLEGNSVSDMINDLLNISSEELGVGNKKLTIDKMLSMFNTVETVFISGINSSYVSLKQTEDIFLFENFNSLDFFGTKEKLSEFDIKILNYLDQTGGMPERLLFVNKEGASSITFGNRSFNSKKGQYQLNGKEVNYLVGKMNTVPNSVGVVQFV